MSEIFTNIENHSHFNKNKMANKKEVSFEDLFKSMSLLNFEIGSQFYAKPTYLIDPHNFFIIPFPFLYHLPLLSKPGKPIQIEDLKENIIVIFKSENPEVNKYFKIDLDENIRGVIQNIRENKKCDIYALDRGFLEKDVTVDRIFFPSSDEAKNTPSLIRHCELHYCAPIGPNFNQSAIDAFKFYIGDEKLSVVVGGKSRNKLKIVVYNSNPDDIATLLALTHYTYLSGNIGEGLNAMTVDCYGETKLGYQHIILNLNEVVNVRVQSGDSLNSFYVTPMSAYKKYLKSRRDFTEFCKAAPVISTKDFEAGAVVGVQDDASFYYERALILEIVEQEKARVKLVDWGTELEVSKNRIKFLKTEFYLTDPAYAIFCCAVDGFVPWDNNLPKFLYIGYTFTIKVKKVGKGFETPHLVMLAET